MRTRPPSDPESSPESPQATVQPECDPRPTDADSDRDVRLFTRSLIVVGILLGILVFGGLAWKHRRQNAQIGEAREHRTLAEFQLTERSGRPVTRGDLKDKVLVVNFVFTGCSLACYEVSRHMAELQGLLANKPAVQLVSFSVDPRTDTPEVLSEFANRLKADPQRWLFLTGDKSEMYRLIETSFLPKAPLDAPSLIPGNFDRAERIVLVDASGRIRRYFDGMSPNAVSEILDALAELDREGIQRLSNIPSNAPR